MRLLKGTLVLFGLMLLAGCGDAPEAQRGEAEVEVDAAPLPALPTPVPVPPGPAPAERTVELSETGRHGFVIDSERSVSVEVIDPLRGPLPRSEQRADHLLPAGSVRLRLRAPDGELDDSDFELETRAWNELHAAPWPVLVDTVEVDTELTDFEQRSWWLDIDERRSVSIELAGRHLDDLRLWRDGDWLMEVPVEARRHEPVSGQPLAIRRLHVELDPGLYRLVAYGGPGEPWTTGSDDTPLHLRKGIPELPPWGWWPQVAGPYGIDRWRLDSDANRIELAMDHGEILPAELEVRRWQPGQTPYSRSGRRSARLDRDARRSRARMSDTPPHQGQRIVEVRTTPGQPYRLSLLHHATSYPLHRPRRSDLWLGVVGLSDPRDTVEPGVLVIERGADRQTPFTAQLAEVSLDQPWQQRFNLLDQVEVLVEVLEAGHYRAELTPDSEAMAEFRIRPEGELVERPADSRWGYASETDWTLNAGIYRLAIRPAAGHRGIAAVRLRSVGEGGDRAPAGAVPGEADEQRPRVAEAHDRLVLDPVRSASGRVALVTDFDEGGGGLVVRQLPLDLDQPLPVSQPPGSVRKLSIQARHDAPLVAVAADGQALELARSADGPWQPRLEFAETATEEIHVRSRVHGESRYTLYWDDDRFKRHRDPLETLDKQRAVPEPPEVLEPGPARALELGRRATAQFELRVPETALYRLETTGLLATSARLASRLDPALADANGGGTGRNALLQQVLPPGDYRLGLGTRGRSAGALALEVDRLALDERGPLEAGRTARATLRPGQALSYQLEVGQRGRYRISAAGLNQAFRVYLTDPEGWPLVRPGRRSPLELELEPGEHRLVILPEAVEARVLTRLDPRQRPPGAREGRGPHRLPLDEVLEYRWREPDEEQAREPDRWQFALDATNRVAVTLAEPMRAELRERSDDGSWHMLRVIEGAPHDTSLELGPGRFELAVRARVADDRLDYRVGVRTEELPAGHERALSVPGELSIALAGDRLVEIGSRGGLDVEAVLFDAQGRRLAASDSRPDDWNFLLSRPLAAGRYRLAVSAIDGASGQIEVFHRQPGERSGVTLAADDSIQIPANGLSVHPLHLPDPGRALVIRSIAPGTHGMSLERREDGRWQTLSTDTGRHLVTGLVPRREDSDFEYRLRVWSIDSLSGPIELKLARAGHRPPRRSGEVEQQVMLERIDADMPAGAALHLARPGLARIESTRRLLFAEPGGVFRPVAPGWLPAAGQRVWLLAPDGAGEVTVQSLTLRSGQAFQLPVGAPLRIGIDQAVDSDRLRLWTVRAPGGAVALASADGISGLSPEAGLVAGRPGEAVEALQLGRADGLEQPLRTRLTARDFDAVDGGRLVPGRRQIVLEPGEAREFALARGGPRDWLLALPAGSLAVFDGAPGRILHASEARSFRVRSQARRLWLVNPGEVPARVGLQLSDSRDGRGEPWPRIVQAGARGERQIRVEAGSRPLRIGGDIEQAWLAADDGRLYPADGERLLARTGWLHLRHGAGAFGVWLEGQGPGTDSPTQRVDLDRRALLRPLSPEPAVVARDEHTAWLDAGQPHTWLVPEGRHDIRATTELPAIEVIEPEPLPAGPGARQRIAGGQALAFEFDLPERTTLGIGLDADRETLAARLLDQQGQVVGDGINQYHADLPAGDYVLVVELAADQAPVEFRPVLLGTDLPDDAIPDAVRERLAALAGAPDEDQQ